MGQGRQCDPPPPSTFLALVGLPLMNILIPRGCLTDQRAHLGQAQRAGLGNTTGLSMRGRVEDSPLFKVCQLPSSFPGQDLCIVH